MGRHLTLAEAAAERGIDASGLRHAIRRGRLRAEKNAGGDWTVTLVDLRRYERSTGDPPAGYITASEAARRMGRTRQRVHQMIGSGQLPARRTRDGRVFVPVEAVGGNDNGRLNGDGN